jgi:hypothetical protein
MQNVPSRYERNAEATLLIGPELHDLHAVRAENCQRYLIWLIRAFLSLLDNRTHGSEQYLPFDSTSPRRGVVDRAGRQDQDENTDE